MGDGQWVSCISKERFPVRSATLAMAFSEFQIEDLATEFDHSRFPDSESPVRTAKSIKKAK
jgi:hypothetical protein